MVAKTYTTRLILCVWYGSRITPSEKLPIRKRGVVSGAIVMDGKCLIENVILDHTFCKLHSTPSERIHVQLPSQTIFLQGNSNRDNNHGRRTILIKGNSRFSSERGWLRSNSHGLEFSRRVVLVEIVWVEIVRGSYPFTACFTPACHYGQYDLRASVCKQREEIGWATKMFWGYCKN